MPTNKNVLISRERYLGSSEISTILGINQFHTRFDLLLEKAGLRETIPVDNPYVEFGNEIEKYIRDYINKEYEDKFVEDTVIVERDVISLRCNYDGKNKTTGLEIKSTSQIHENVRDYKYYIVQLLYGMMLANLKHGVLLVYRRNEDFQVNFEPERLQKFEINIKDYMDWVEEIEIAVEQFINDLSRLKQDPFLTEEDLLPLDLKEISQQVIVLENRLIEYKQLEQEAKEMKEKLKQAMEKSGKSGWTTPSGIKITLVPNGEDKVVKKFNESKFKEEHEKTWNKYCDDVIQKGKSGYVRITLKKD